MGNILTFNICAIPIFIIILTSTFIRKTTKGEANRWFIVLSTVSLAAAVVDLIADGYGLFLPLSPVQLHIVTITNYLYFALRNATIVLYLFFLFALTRTDFRFRSKRVKFLLILPYLIILGLLLTNPWHHRVFTIRPDIGYSRGPLILVFYIISVGYAILGTFYLISCARFIRSGKWIALISMYVLSFIAIFIQFFNSKLLVEMFSTAVSFLIVILIVLRPEEITDPYVGLPSWKAYREELRKMTLVRYPAKILITRFLNASQIRTYLGEERYNQYIKRIAEQLALYAKEKHLRLDLYYEAPGIIYWILDNASPLVFSAQEFYSVNNRIELATQDIKIMGVHLNPRTCLINYPEDLVNADDIIHLGHEFHGLIQKDNACIRASELIDTRHYILGTKMGSILSQAIILQNFEMYYQPIYHISDGKFHSAEALIRLKDEQFGTISPEIFIPAAESRGLIIPIGDFVIDSVFRFIAEHDLSELGLEYIEINLSVAQCLEIGLPKKIREMQDRYHISPAQVNFEITETTYDEIGTLADSNIASLAEMGYSFSLDDYGTGYSNMQRILRLPLSLIKIDKTLVKESASVKGRALIRNTIAMMKDINKKIVAEGVESEAQFNYLKEIGCDYIQGFFFSKPLSQDEFLMILRNGNHRDSDTEQPEAARLTT
ncbi:MAG: EAL domain-containing protein [Treponema sp.]|nr:EAL domain-containing protein [Treponema sp.]